MTSEIAILNSYGIALAADSAVTIGNQKVYNSANKLFTLSKHHPVGIMVYDSAELMNIPWETIIKEYRSKLRDKSFSTLKEYANDFWEFLAKDDCVIPEQSKTEYVEVQAINYLQMLYYQVEEQVKLQIESDGETSLSKTYEIFSSVLNQSEDILNGHGFIEGFAEADVNDIRNKYRIRFQELASQQFGDFFGMFEDVDKERIYSHISNLFVRSTYLLPKSGLVIAGFGEKDVFPKIASYFVEGVVGNIVKKQFNEGKSNIQHDSFVTTIVPFAQDEMVWTFISGIDPDINKFAMAYLEDIFKKYPNKLTGSDFDITDSVMANIKAKMVEDGMGLLDKFANDLYKFQRKNNSQPILDMVGVLPKDELAAMAESLVNLTVFKRKVSKAMETVGGPIDVAIISKGDGFIWVKRKHYFEPHLNHNFFTNYFK